MLLPEHPTTHMTVKQHIKKKIQGGVKKVLNKDFFQRGMASWYGIGDGMQGNLTASGAKFDTYSRMCASRTIPLGTRIKITNLKNYRTSTCVIKDVGPFVYGRILDLSYLVKREIGMDGTAYVGVLIVK